MGHGPTYGLLLRKLGRGPTTPPPQSVAIGLHIATPNVRACAFLFTCQRTGAESASRFIAHLACGLQSYENSVLLGILAIAGEIEKDLTPKARRKVYEAMRRLPADAHRLEMGVMEFKLTEVDRRIAERLQRLSAVKALVNDRLDADPIIRGTDIPVYVIAALARGQTVAEIVEDYTGLTPEQIDAAVEYAKSRAIA